MSARRDALRVLLRIAFRNLAASPVRTSMPKADFLARLRARVQSATVSRPVQGRLAVS